MQNDIDTFGGAGGGGESKILTSIIIRVFLRNWGFKLENYSRVSNWRREEVVKEGVGNFFDFNGGGGGGMEIIIWGGWWKNAEKTVEKWPKTMQN